MSSVKKVLANAALAGFSLALALALGEIAVRLLFKDATVLFPRYHKDYHYGKYTIRGIRPNAEFRHTSVDGSWTFVTNARGFRNTREFAYAKPAGTLRVLSLGDSHTQGYEVRQEFTFSAVAERVLRGRNVDAEVINAGVSGDTSTGSSRAPRRSSAVRQRLVAILNSQARMKPRSSRPCMPRQARTSVSCSASSASCREPSMR